MGLCIGLCVLRVKQGAEFSSCLVVYLKNTHDHGLLDAQSSATGPGSVLRHTLEGDVCLRPRFESKQKWCLGLGQIRN